MSRVRLEGPAYEGIRCAIDGDHWTHLSAWADMLEEKGDDVGAMVMRWLIKHKRIPREKTVKGSKYDGQKPYKAYFWLWQDVGGPSGIMLNQVWTRILKGTSSHAVPYAFVVPEKETSTRMSTLYIRAIETLRYCVGVWKDK